MARQCSSAHPQLGPGQAISAQTIAEDMANNRRIFPQIRRDDPWEGAACSVTTSDVQLISIAGMGPPNGRFQGQRLSGSSAT
jgi:hypothetical protein